MLAGVANFRDVGGLPVTGGGRLRSGRLFRSASLQEATEDDVRVLVAELSIRYVLDLRTAEESVQQGRGLLGRQPVCYLNVPLIDVDSPTAPPGEIVLAQYLDHLAVDENLPLALEVLAAAVAHPTLVHCAAGKDRTGVVSALVELCLGVPAEHVVADYMRTAAAWDAVLAKLRGWPRYAGNMARLPAEIYRVEEHVITGLVTAVEERYGGAREWARQRGVADEALAALRHHLVEA
jgi:protein-tyrosine phosphatase